MAQPGSGGTVDTEARAVHLLIHVIGQGDAVKATIKCKPGKAAAVLKLLASHRDAGPGVLEDKDKCSIPESDDILQPDAGPFKYLLYEGAASTSGQAGAGAGAPAGLTPETVAAIEQIARDFDHIKMLRPQLSLLQPQLSLWLSLLKPSIWPTPSKASSGRDKNFRKRLQTFYDNRPHPETKLMKCMITGWQVPSAAIRAGHLIPVRLPAIAKALGVDINNSRNGLLWCDFIEAAFECWAICFSFGPLPNSLKLHVVNKKVASMKLVDWAECKDEDYVNMLGDKVFGSLQEGTIFSASGTSGKAFPLQRAIAWHASAAIDMARTKGLLPDSFKAEDVVLKVTSEFDEAEALEVWASMCREAGPPEEVSTIVEDEDEGLDEEELEA